MRATRFVPSGAWRLRVGSWLAAIAETWISLNGFILGATQRIDWGVNGSGDLHRDDWYLLICNHQSWVDILVLQRVFNRRIPFLKFFIKRELAWMPSCSQPARDLPSVFVVPTDEQRMIATHLSKPIKTSTRGG